MKFRKKGLFIFSFIFTLFFVFSFTGSQLASQGNIYWTITYAVCLLGVSVVMGGFFGFMVSKGFFLLSKLSLEKTQPKETKKEIIKVGIISLGFILLAWLPTYLAYYPGICSYDITIQTGQIESGVYTDHHPLAHTLLLQGFLFLGKMFGSINLGMGIYTFVQMVLLAMSMSIGITVLYQRTKPKVFLIVLQLYAMFFPFHWYLSVSATKDTIFTSFVLLWILSIYQVLTSKMVWKDKASIWEILLFISTIGSLLFRNNGKYAMILVIGILCLVLLFGKKTRGFYLRIMLNLVLGFMLGNLLLSTLFSAVNAVQGDRREMLSIPIQQMARTMIYHGGVGVLEEDDNTMKEEYKEYIHQFILKEAYVNYRADIADPVKSHTNTAAVRYQVKDFLQTYLGLFVTYPGDYINAVLAVDAGYLYPFDRSHSVINVNGRDTGLGYIQTRWVDAELNPRGIYKDTKWESLYQGLEKFADENAYLKLPLLKYLMMPGMYLWFYFLFAGYLLWHRKYKMLLPLSFVLGYYITLLLGPTVQLRYLYPIMITLPFMMLYTYGEEKNANLLSE